MEVDARSHAEEKRGLSSIVCLVVVLVLLVIADGFISRYIAFNGLGTEGNPVLQPLIEGGAFLPLKLVGSLVVGGVILDLHRRLPIVAHYTGLAAICLYTAILYWNLAVLVSSLA